jgi:iron complex outermembrane receptor protein
MNHYKYFPIYLIFSVSAVLKSQSNAMDSVTIKELRLPGLSIIKAGNSAYEISKSQFEKLPVRDLSEALSFAPGVQMFQRGPNGSQADLIIDGGSFDQGLLLVNGFKFNDFQTGHNLMNIPFNLTSIKGIQIHRGARGRMYGPGALSGAINLIVEPSDKNGISLHSFAGTNGVGDSSSGETYTRIGTMFSATLGNSRNRLLLNFQIDSSNGYRYNSGSKRLMGSLVSTHKISKLIKLKTMLGYNNNYYGAGYFYAAPFDNKAKERVETMFAGIELEHSVANWINKLRVYGRSNYDNYVFNKFNPSIYENKHFSKSLNFELQSTKLNKYGATGLGLEYRNQDINSNNLGEHYRNNLGLYVEQRFLQWNNLTTTAGAYVNYNNEFGVSLFPGIEMSYSIDPGLAVFANINRGLRNPSFTDLYYSDRGNIGNSELSPESGTSSEFGFKLSQKKLFFTTNIFSRHLNNMIVWRDIDTSSLQYWKPENIGEVNFYGLSFQLNKMRHELKGKFGVTWQISYNFIGNTNNLEGTKTPILAYRHQLLGSFTADYKQRISIRLAGRYFQQLNGYDYPLLDLRLDYKYKVNIFYFDINNLSNKTYRLGGNIPMPGRYLNLGWILEIY